MNLLRIFKKQRPTVLGRWSKLDCDKALEQRIKLANIDNCGPCGLDEKEQSNEKSNKQSNKQSNKSKYDRITFRYDKMSDKDLDVYMSFMYGS